MLRKIFWFLFSCTILLALAGGVFATWGYYYITRDLPKLTRIEDYSPPAVSMVYASDGTLMAEFYEEQRYPVRLNEIPLMVRNAFLAAEDSSFYTHPGIDIVSIARAAVKNLQTGGATQGASTITQQVVKNLLLTSQKRLDRKIKEAILAYQLEQHFSKDEILEIYLNQMFFGNGAYGIKAAATNYYHKELSDLTLPEAALLAGLLKAPSGYSPITNFPSAKRRQRYVLNQMVKAKFITSEVSQKAQREDLKIYPVKHEKILHSPYYATEVRRLLVSRFGSEGALDRAGYQIFTACNLEADIRAERALKRGLQEVDKRRGWRGPLKMIEVAERPAYLQKLSEQNGSALVLGEIYKGLVTKVSIKDRIVWVSLGENSSAVSFKDAEWAKRRLDSNDRVHWSDPLRELKEGHVIEVSLRQNSSNEKVKNRSTVPEVVNSLQLDQSPEIEGAISLIDPHTGKVYAMVGGYDYKRSVFNRVTQSLRQPGSSFKPIIYLAAVDRAGFTPATIVYDEPRAFTVGDQVWAPANFDNKFLGPIPMRMALEKSRNLATVDIVSRIGLPTVIEYAKKLGITSELGRNPSLALGSSEVTLLEMVRAYGVFPAKGVLFPSGIITKIVDRKGNVIYDYDSEMLAQARQVVKPQSAFIMANMMKGVVERGTATRVRVLNRPVAGKTGTSNDQMDTWFIGYTPDWVAGVWVGFDTKRTIGEKETGGRVAAPIFVYFMKDFFEYQDKLTFERLVAESKEEAERLGIEPDPVEPLAPLDFTVPEGVDPVWINRYSGRATSPDDPEALVDYFVRGTEPNAAPDESEQYLQSPDI